jgi:hypothetical protein
MDLFNVFVWLGFILIIPVIALLDSEVFGKYAQCEICGAKPMFTKWHWILPCALEYLFFLTGVLVGLTIYLTRGAA